MGYPHQKSQPNRNTLQHVSDKIKLLNGFLVLLTDVDNQVNESMCLSITIEY